MNTSKIFSRTFLIILNLVLVGCSNNSIGDKDSSVNPVVTQITEPTPMPPSIEPRPNPIYPYPIITPTPVPFNPPPYPPPILDVSSANLPILPTDLLFLDGGSLKYWARGANQLETLAGAETGEIGPVFMYSANSLTREIALVRKQSPFVFEIALLNLDSRQFSYLIETGSSVPLGISLSPDGNWLAYILPDAQPDSYCRLANVHPEADPYDLTEECGGTVYLLPLASPDQVSNIGTCAEKIFTDDKTGCHGFIWSPNSRSVYWSDANGIWIAEIDRQGQLFIDSSGITQLLPDIENNRFIEFVDWSASGRFLTMEVQYMGGWGWAILDTEERRIYGLSGVWPFSFQRVTWLQDERLFTLQPYRILDNLAPTGAIWRIDSENLPALIQEARFSIPLPAENFPFAPAQWPDGHISFAVVNGIGSAYDQRGLFFVEQKDFVIQKTNGLPPSGYPMMDGWVYNQNLYWTPDGSGAIYYQYYIPMDDSPLYYLGSLISVSANDFTWITP